MTLGSQTPPLHFLNFLWLRGARSLPSSAQLLPDRLKQRPHGRAQQAHAREVPGGMKWIWL